MASFLPLHSELGHLLRLQPGPSAYVYKHSQWTLLEVHANDLEEGGLFAEKEFGDDTVSCPWRWNCPVLSGSKFLPALPVLLPASLPAALCTPGKAGNSAGLGGYSHLLPPFAATAGFASMTKEEAGPQRCTVDRDTRMCLCLCVFSSLHEAAPVVSWIAACLFGGSWLLTSPPGQHWGKDHCMPSTEGCRCMCIQACILHAEIHFGAIPVHVAQRHRISIHST